MKEKNDKSIRFLYGTVFGRGLLKLIQKLRADRLIVRFLRSSRSRLFTVWYVRRHNIPISREELRQYSSFRDFFARKKDFGRVDVTPGHLISPCDGWLSVYPITEGSSFAIKGSRYRVEDLLEDPVLAKNYKGGDSAQCPARCLRGLSGFHTQPPLLVPDGNGEFRTRCPDGDRRADRGKDCQHGRELPLLPRPGKGPF